MNNNKVNNKVNNTLLNIGIKYISLYSSLNKADKNNKLCLQMHVMGKDEKDGNDEKNETWLCTNKKKHF